MTRSIAFVLLVSTACRRLPPTNSNPGSGDDDDSPAAQPAAVRVATWNVEGLGDLGSDEFEAVAEVLERLRPDVVGFNEFSGGEDAEIAALADRLGMDFVIPNTNPFGDLHNGVLSRLPIVSSEIWTSSALSGDPQANDLTRWPVAVEVDVAGVPLTFVIQHWKSGFYTEDEFRRIVDSTRTAQSATRADSAAVVLCGDVNAELTDPAPSVDTWTYVPSGMPSGWELGDDLQQQLDGDGLPNDTFLPVFDAGLVVVDALQRDGREGTRDSSGRRLDHLFVSDAVEVVGGEVYDARDDDMDGLALFGDAPDREATVIASDHFPVFADLIVRP